MQLSSQSFLLNSRRVDTRKTGTQTAQQYLSNYGAALHAEVRVQPFF